LTKAFEGGKTGKFVMERKGTHHHLERKELSREEFTYQECFAFLAQMGE